MPFFHAVYRRIAEARGTPQAWRAYRQTWWAEFWLTVVVIAAIGAAVIPGLFR